MLCPLISKHTSCHLQQGSSSGIIAGQCFHGCLQVVADHMRGGTVSVFGISGLEVPAKFSCWISLAVTQILVPQASFTGHLCGVLAGLMHVYIPKAGMDFQSSATMPPANCKHPCHGCKYPSHVLVWLQLAYRKEVMSITCCCLVAGLLLLVGCKLHCLWRSCLPSLVNVADISA